MIENKLLRLIDELGTQIVERTDRLTGDISDLRAQIAVLRLRINLMGCAMVVLATLTVHAVW